MIGQTLSHFRITAKLGEGGMGEVYRAEDSKLGREVAIKVLPAELTTDPERLARFEREARVLASLNHPNIAGIHEVGSEGDVNFLVMELVEGETLEEVMRRGALEPDQALGVALQMAYALEAAHEKGIVHRDLKPANVKVAPEGSTGVQVKVLDFGLAKAWEQDEKESSPALSMSPTLTAQMTQAGVILGTAAYMSPEQARGQVVDKRSDIWSFGVMLYEMLAGGQAFQGDTVTDLIAAVVTQQPDPGRLPAELPQRVRQLLARCLEKDSMQRLRDIGDARIEIQAVLDSPGEEMTGTGADPEAAAVAVPGPRWLWPALAALGLVAAGTMAVLHFGAPAPPDAEEAWFEVRLDSPSQGYPSLSPDGQMLAYQMRTGDSGDRHIWLRRLDSLEATEVPRTAGLWGPMPWSPDGRSILFASEGGVRALDLAGGPPRLVAELPGRYTGGVWGVDGTVLFGNREDDWVGIYRVASTGGTPTLVTRSSQETGAHVPGSILPDGRHFLYSRFERGTPATMHIGDLEASPEEQVTTALLAAESVGTYIPHRRGDSRPGTGHILLVRDGVLLAQPFDAGELALVGDPTPIAEGLVKNGFGYTASGNGSLAFATGSTTESELVRFSRQGERLGEIGGVAEYAGIMLSSDDEYLVVVREDPGEPSHLWVVELARGVFTRLNPGDRRDYSPAVSSDGRVAFTSEADIFARRINGVGDAVPLVTGDTTKHPNDWSPDGRYLIYDDHIGNRQDLLFVRTDGGDTTPVPILDSEATETHARFSPDGGWFVYTSNESGRYEVYIRDFQPDRSPAHGNEKLQVSVDGGNKPLWSADGSEIYYLDPGGVVHAVAVKTSPRLEVGSPIRLFETHTSTFVPYDVTASGEFIVNSILGAGGPPPPITMVLNWQSMLD